MFHSIKHCFILDVKDLNVNPKPLGLATGKETPVKSRAHPPGDEG
jgi:hypothetical protein